MSRNDDDPAVKRARRLGIGHDLALKVGEPDLHVSLVFFSNVKSDYEKQLIRDMAQAFFESSGFAAEDDRPITLELGDKCYDRSVEVKGKLCEVQQKLEKHFQDTVPNFLVNPNPLLHIDLRGQPLSAVKTQLSLSSPVWLH